MKDIYVSGKGKTPDDDNSGDVYITGGKHNENAGGHSGDVYITGGKNSDTSAQGSHGNYDYERFSERGSRNDRHGSHKKKKKSFFRRLVSAVLLVCILFGVCVGFTFAMFSTVNYNETGHRENVYLNSSELMQDSAVENILLIGVDRRAATDDSRSDSMLLFSIDKKTSTVRLTSFMRDTWVYIPDSKRYAKLNAACKYGGAQLVMDTIEYNFNVKIDNYVLVDFNIFTDIVDSFGGVKVEISEKEAAYMRDKVHLQNITAGESVALNGKEALWYCRIRYLDSDFMRTQRQRKVMTALISKAKRSGVIRLRNVVKSVMPQIETDLTPAKLTGLSVGAAFKYRFYDVEQARVPADGTWEDAIKDGQEVLLSDLGANQSYLKKFLYSE